MAGREGGGQDAVGEEPLANAKGGEEQLWWLVGEGRGGPSSFSLFLVEK